MAAQPANSGQNTGLIVFVVGVFMVIIAFVAVTYLNSDTIKENQDKNSQTSQTQRSDLTQITCAIWRSTGVPKNLDAETLKRVRDVCGPTP